MAHFIPITDNVSYIYFSITMTHKNSSGKKKIFAVYLNVIPISLFPQDLYKFQKLT